MLSRLPTLTDDGGCGLEVDSPAPAFSLADEDSSHAGVFPSVLPQSFASLPHPPPPPSAPCCSCVSLLPRLLAVHRLEVRRLLRGALASLGRRLDSLERRSKRNGRKKKRRKQREGGEGVPTFNCSSASSSKPTPLSPVRVSSFSSDSNKPAPSSFSQSEQTISSEREVSRRKKRRKNHKEFNLSDIEENNNEEEEGGRFVGQMAVSFRGRGAEEEESLILSDFSQKKRKRDEERSIHPEKAVGVMVRRNGYSSTSQNALQVLQTAEIGQTCGQSGVFSVSGGQWRFSDIITHLSSNQSVFHLWLSHAPPHISSAPVLHLSTIRVEMMLNLVRDGACWSPLWPLKDWTAPPSLSSDHCYVRRLTSSSPISAWRQQKQQTNQSAQSLHRRRVLPLPLCPANGLSDALPTDQSATVSKFLHTDVKLGKRVSQIRIRRASPREMSLTPMGLPKVKRLKKKEFSLEEIYTNKNYESPPNNRSLETIFEEPREKDGAQLLIGQQKRRRLLLFSDFTQPRKRKRPQCVGLAVATVPRKRAAARRHILSDGLDDRSDLDVMLVERLSALEDFLIEQALDV